MVEGDSTQSADRMLPESPVISEGGLLTPGVALSGAPGQTVRVIGRSYFHYPVGETLGQAVAQVIGELGTELQAFHEISYLESGRGPETVPAAPIVIIRSETDWVHSIEQGSVIAILLEISGILRENTTPMPGKWA